MERMGRVLREFARISIHSQHEEAFVTLAMLPVDRARTRMQLVWTVISMLVLTVFGALSFMSWLLEKNAATPEMHVPQSNTSATTVSAVERTDLEARESWGIHGREF